MIDNKNKLFELMSDGVTVVTPNNRLSNQLLHDFFVSGKQAVKDKPQCLPYQAFLHGLFNRLRHHYPHVVHPVVLSQHQQQHVWRQLLNTSHEGLVQAVRQAWTRCQLWQIDEHHPLFAQNSQSLQYQRWQQQFRQQLETLGAISEEQLVPYLANYPDIFGATSIVWACFDDYTPQQRTLQLAMQAKTCSHYQYDLPPKPITTQQYPAKDTHDECLQLVDWLKSRLAQGEQHIGVVVPDLQGATQQLQRLLQRHLPESQFNISLGEPLSDYPLAAHALNLLSLDKETISNHQARFLLHSPYLAGAKSELLLRAQVLQDSNVLQEAKVSVSTLIKECRSTAPQLAAMLANLADYPQQASPHEWINHFKQRLHHWGFPGEYTLQSFAYQCLQRFLQLIDELLPLALVTPVLSQTQALDCLRDLAQNTIFQVRKSARPIQILGLLEASGCAFDSIWVCGLTDQCLPQKTSFSAFIPIALQRDNLMPHALAARELQFAQQLLQRLQDGSALSVFSYPRLTGDMPNLPSPLISHLPVLASNFVPAVAVSRLIPRQENYQVPLATDERITGGTALLANQAKCPFRAFASHRLHAKSAPDISTGPNASERGQVVHKIMDSLWRTIRSQHNLRALGSTELDQCIEQAIVMALQPFIAQRPHSFSTLIQDVELARLKQLVYKCLEWDMQRPPFVVEAVEQAFTIHLAGIDFQVRVDRIDSVADKKWVIDYKSSLPVPNPWYEERPEEPQLLLYALLDETINVLLFLQLKNARLTCSGLSEYPLALKGISPLKKGELWPKQQALWQEQLYKLASELANGHCPPVPARDTTCQRCDFQNLCRIEL